MLVLWVEKQVSSAGIRLLVEGAYYLPQSDVPHDEEKPIPNDQLALTFECGSVGYLCGDVRKRPTMRPILLQVSYQVSRLHSLNEMV